MRESRKERLRKNETVLETIVGIKIERKREWERNRESEKQWDGESKIEEDK